MSINIKIDPDKCIGSGACAVVAPEIFGLDDDGVVIMVDEHPSDDKAELAQEAATACPAWVIEIESK